MLRNKRQNPAPTKSFTVFTNRVSSEKVALLALSKQQESTTWHNFLSFSPQMAVLVLTTQVKSGNQ
jgi:hypothetical protein